MGSTTHGIIVGVKLSVSLPDDVVAFVDKYAESHSEESRSAVVRKALKLLREAELVEAYRSAYTEWHQSGEDAVWDVVAGDGIQPGNHEAR